jgi:HSP20 family protein
MLARRKSSGDVLDWFSPRDRLFEEWMRSLPLRRPLGLAWDWPGDDLIRVDEFRDGNVQVFRAELPGVDPEKDVELTLVAGMLCIKAERRIEEESQDKGYQRHEIRYGTFNRTLPLPDGVDESDISASYRDGILEVRVPIPDKQEEPEAKTISISKG